MRRATTEGLVLVTLLVIGLLGALGWNISRYVGAEPQIRVTNTLQFLPDPPVAQALSLGQSATVSKLMLLDAYTFMQHVLDTRDDTVAGDDRRGGFLRLFETLIHLDPKFEPFYTKGATLVGITDDNHAELYLLRRGLDEMPDNTAIWGYHMAVLSTFYQIEERDPELLQALLSEWAGNEIAKGAAGRPHLAIDWQKGLQRRVGSDLGQLMFWSDAIGHAGGPYTAMGKVLLGRMREALTTYQQDRLQAAWDAAGGPDDLLAICRGPILGSIYGDVKLIDGPAEPFIRDGERIGIRPDPWGYHWRLDDDGVVCDGLALYHLEQHLAQANVRVQLAVRQHRRWPEDDAEARRWAGIAGLDVPASITFVWDGEVWSTTGGPEAVTEPWSLSELRIAAGLAIPENN